MKIYCVHPISGLTPEAVMGYYSHIVEYLRYIGYDVYYPMIGKGEFRPERTYKSNITAAHTNPLVSNHAIFARDKWMVTQADVIYADFTEATSISIGSIMELAWANMLGKHIVLAMNKENIHSHSFVLEAVSVVFETSQDAEAYLETLLHRKASLSKAV